jgi:CDP-diacylglycerol--glycerol-3-phosphate 3-phosphatidyltransferase
MRRLDAAIRNTVSRVTRAIATADHRQAVRDHGLSPAHRQSFCGWLAAEEALARQGVLMFESGEAAVPVASQQVGDLSIEEMEELAALDADFLPRGIRPRRLQHPGVHEAPAAAAKFSWIRLRHGGAMLPDLITLLRVVLAFVTVSLFHQNSTAAIWAVGLTIVSSGWMRWTAGSRVAPARRATWAPSSTSPAIASSENVYWIYFATVGAVSYWVPLIVITRGFLTGTVRTLSFEHGKTPFGEKTMMRSNWSRFLVSGRFMRGLYGGAKVAAFRCARRPARRGPRHRRRSLDHRTGPMAWLSAITTALVVITVFLCVVRGLPVLWDGRDLLLHRPGAEAARLMPRPAAIFDLDGTLLADTSAERLFLGKVLTHSNPLAACVGESASRAVSLPGSAAASPHPGPSRAGCAAPSALPSKRWVSNAFTTTSCRACGPSSVSTLAATPQRGEFIFAHRHARLPRHGGLPGTSAPMQRATARLERRDGRFTGRVLEPVPHGVGKLRALERIGARRTISISRRRMRGRTAAATSRISSTSASRTQSPEWRAAASCE